MKFLKWLGIIILSLIVLFLVIPVFLSSNYHIERSTSIKKPVGIVFQAATDMNLRKEWDPWIEMEPKAKIKVSITPEVIGSGYSWKGDVIGEGEITILEFVPNELIKSKVHFIAPQNLHADILWTFKQNNEFTEITWAFEGTLSYLNRWGALFMDKSLGASFEKGLENFKTLVEKIPDTTGRTGEIKQEHFDGIKALSIKKKVSMQKLTSNMFTMYTDLMAYLNENDLDISGSPFTIYHPCKEEGFTLLECALPINTEFEGKDQIKYIELPESNVVIASHFGHFNTAHTTYEAINNYILENNLVTSGTPWEMYITDPTKEFDQSKWETHVYFPVK